MLILVVLSCCLIVTYSWRHIVHLLLALLIALLALGIVYAEQVWRESIAPALAIERAGPLLDRHELVPVDDDVVGRHVLGHDRVRRDVRARSDPSPADDYRASADEHPLRQHGIGF